ncbi:hypothetical protein [Microlunatus soli]|uniref:Uncharacterized protein n=1 Tax=Microlunatus soli TaxID=630515 RepID=A0A1H1QL61_9ACTN|nr:hypothetical protein [Microlunatus soli]SDS24126.1 hypothetical protein SAMN04489812_1308 [Microlunatus soli]
MAEDKLIAIQVGAVSFVDEGIDRVLTEVQARAGVNALFLATPTWTRGTGGRAVPGHPIPDHGVQAYDHDYIGGNYAVTHPEFYGGTDIPPVPKNPEHPDFDLLGDVIGEAKKRGMASYAWMEESSYIQAVRDIPNMPKSMEVDVHQIPSSRPCFNNPDYRNWHLGIVEDYVKSYDLDGLAWCSERPGPLNACLAGPISSAGLTCFCRHCRAIARDRGIDADRAIRGYTELLEWNTKLQSGVRHADGAFSSFWRILLRFPEVLAWQNLWTESQRRLYRDIYGVAKASNRNLEVGWHVFHDISFSPFYRADQDYAELGKLSDFIKVVAYNNCAGPRFHHWVHSIGTTLFADVAIDQVYGFLQGLLNYDEAPLEELPQVGFSSDYVRRETERAQASVPAGTKIYPGIDIDIPVGFTPAAAADRAKRFESVPGMRTGTALNTDTSTGDDLTRSTPEAVKQAVLAAFGGGADGVVLSRKYSEMFLDNLSGAGAALDELGLR